MVISNKKSNFTSFFAKKNLIKTRGDIASIFLLIIIVFSLHVKYTQPLFKIFITLHHNVTNEESIFSRKFTSGSRDILTIFTIVCLLQVYFETLKEYVIEKILRRFHLSKTKKSETEQLIYLSMNHLIVFSYCIKVLDSENYLDLDLLNLSSIRSSLMTFEEKVFYLIFISYWLQIIAESMFVSISSLDLIKRVSRCLAFISFLLFFYNSGLLNFGLVLILLESLSSLISYVYFIINNTTSDKTISKNISKPCFILVIFFRLALVTITLYVIFFGTIRHTFDSVLILNSVIIRYVFATFYVLYQIYVSYRFYLEQRNCIKADVKNTDNPDEKEEFVKPSTSKIHRRTSKINENKKLKLK